jgi:hypothetical protein
MAAAAAASMAVSNRRLERVNIFLTSLEHRFNIAGTHR